MLTGDFNSNKVEIFKKFNDDKGKELLNDCSANING